MQIVKIYCDLCRRKVYQDKLPPCDYPHEKLTVMAIGVNAYGGGMGYDIKYAAVCLDCHSKIVNGITKIIAEIKKTKERKIACYGKTKHNRLF